MKKILIVDDDEGILDALKAAIEMEGYQVTTLSSGILLTNKVREFQPDLILIDLLLAGRDSSELVQAMKKNPETASVPIIMLSAHPEAAKKAKDSAADDFIAKPFDLHHLFATIKKHLKEWSFIPNDICAPLK